MIGNIKYMKSRFKFILILIVLIQIAISIWLAFEIIKRKYPQVLGVTSVSIINKSTNTPNVKSNLQFYYEPVASQKETDQAQWSKGIVVYTYNNDTLNDRFDYSVEKPEKTYRIIVLGDSYAFGEHVNTADSWPEKLEDALNANKICKNYDKYEVLNLGVRGFDIQDEVERYRLRGQKYNPDLVIWMLIQNDFDEINELSMPLEKKYYEQLKNENKLDPLSLRSESDDLGIKEFLRTYDEKQRFAIEDRFFSDFNELYQGPLLLVTFPFLDGRYKTHMQQWAQQRSASYYEDSLPDIYAQDDLNFDRYGDGHPTKLAHTMIAKKIYQYIVDNSLISCK